MRRTAERLLAAACRATSRQSGGIGDAICQLRFASAHPALVNIQKVSSSAAYPTLHSLGSPAMRGLAAAPFSTAAETPMDPEHVHIGNEIDKTLLKASHAKDLDSLFKELETHGEFFSETNVVTAFEQLSHISDELSEEDVESKIHESKSFQTLVDMAILSARRYSNRQLLNVLAACAKMGFEDEMLLDKLSGQLLKRFEKMSAEELHDLVTGLANAGYSPSVVLFDALQQRAVAMKDQFNSELADGLKGAFKQLGYEDIAKQFDNSQQGHGDEEPGRESGAVRMTGSHKL